MLTHGFFHFYMHNIGQRCAGLITLPFLLLTGLVYGQPHFEQLSIEQGLSQSVVNAIVQDDDGLMWFGTQDGLNRYDGYQFQVLRHRNADPDSLPDSHITQLLVDSHKDLWVGTLRGVARYSAHTGKFQSFHFADAHLSNAPEDYILSLAQDSVGHLWVGTANGLHRFDYASQKMSDIAYSEMANGLLDRRVRSLWWDESRAIMWIGSNGGLQRWEAHSEQLKAMHVALGHKVEKIVAVSDEQLWLGTDGGVIAYAVATDSDDSMNAEFKKCNSVLAQHGEIQDIAVDPNDDKWIATAQGVLRVDGHGGECNFFNRQFKDSSSLSANDVLSLYVDHNSLLWLGTYAGGVNKWNTRAKSFVQLLDGQWGLQPGSSNAFMTVLRDHAGEIWAGTVDAGLLHQSRTGAVESVKFSRGAKYGTVNVVNSLAEDGNGNLWIGSQDQGLFRRDVNTGQIRPVIYADANSEFTYIASVYIDHLGRIWIGTDSGFMRLIERTDGRFDTQVFDLQLPENFRKIDREVSSIVDDWQGNVWLAGSAGLVYFEPDKNVFTLYQTEPNNRDSLSSNDITCLLWSPQGDLWIATSDGLNRGYYSSDGRWHVERFTTATGLPIAQINALLPGSDGEIWLGTNGGLFRFDPAAKSFLHFRSEEGLPSDEFNTRAQALGRDGELLFGTINGVVSFYPSKLHLPQPPPAPVLVAWRKYDVLQNLPDASGLVLNSDDRVIALDFAVPDYANAARNRFRYRIIGLHDHWVALEGAHSISLTGLETGHYQLEVQGANAASLWGEQSYRLPLHVFGPYWNLHRRYSTGLAIVIGLAVLVVWFQRRWYLRLKSALFAEQHYSSQSQSQLRTEIQKLDEKHRKLLNDFDAQDHQMVDLVIQLDQMAQMDILTGLPNRMALNEYLQSRLRRFDFTTAVFMVNLDGLRVINEQYGWLAGDQVLAQTADMLCRLLPKDDRVFRFYADVFVLVCTVNTNDDARLLAEKIRSAVLQKAFHIAQRRRADITSCISYVCMPAHLYEASISIDLIYSLLEQANDLAKQHGRNAWVGYSFKSGLIGANVAARTSIAKLLRSGVVERHASLLLTDSIALDELNVLDNVVTKS